MINRRRRSSIRTKLTVYFGLLLSTAFVASGLLIYTRVETVVSQTIDSSLESISDLIQRIVQVSIENNRGQVKKDLIVAEHFVGQDISLDTDLTWTIAYRDSITEETGIINLPTLRFGSTVINPDSSLLERIARETDGIIAIYQVTDRGLLCVSSTQNSPKGYYRIGELIPSGAPYDILVRREGTYFGRDYFDRQWHLTAYKLLFAAGKPVAVLYVAQEQTDIAELRNDILSIKVGHSGGVFIIDTLSTLVVHPTLEGQNLYHMSHIQDLIFRKNGKIKHTEIDKETSLRREYISYFKFIPEMNWIVVVGSSIDDFFGGLYTIRYSLIAIFITMLASTLTVSVLVGRRIALPILVVAQKLKDIADGEADLSKRLYVGSNDEVEELALHFNRYLEKLRALKEIEERELEVALTDARIGALQAQINPHFLYNTLETVRFMIALGDKRAESMVQLLADLFRVSIGKGEHYVKLSQELRHVGLYMDIQLMRFPGKFRLEIEVSDSLLDAYMVKFLIQPLVENAILHGFENLESGGVIRIRTAIAEGDLFLSVSDNGSGIAPDQLAMLRSQLNEHSPMRSIGLLNIHKRLLLHFGHPYGLSLDATIGQGTTVVLRMPLIYDKQSIENYGSGQDIRQNVKSSSLM